MNTEAERIEEAKREALLAAEAIERILARLNNVNETDDHAIDLRLTLDSTLKEALERLQAAQSIIAQAAANLGKKGHTL
jgi:hypothetical protein